MAGNEANDFACFGDPSRFEIAVAWLADADPVARRPAEHGWSMGKLQITIAGVNITESRVDGAQTGFVGWYLSPFFDWLATHWAALLHEDDFAWGERTAQPAAIACRRALDLNRGGESPAARATYKRIQSWFFRHGVRAASAGGLFPDLFIRRFEDDIELSWTPTPILCAPQDFAFASPVGAAYLAVSDVGGPLWDALQWAVAHTPVNMAPSFRDNWLNLCDKVAALNVADAATLDRTIDPTLFDRVLTSFKARGRQDLVVEQVANDNPWINVRSAAVAMYGGVNPQLQTSDVDRLRDILIDAAGGTDTERLAGLIEDRAGVPLDVPHRQGYEFALDLLDEMNLPAAGDDFIDVVALCAALGVTIRDETLDTDSIRGVALAGEGFRPVAVVNRRSFFNANEEGRRFSIAHELCHILHDRTRARRIAHVSGQWAPPGIEKRANAFAAYLLMPRELIEQHLGDLLAGSEENVTLVAGKMKVNESALVEHLYNLYMISEYDRECLRSVFSPSKH
ncbi:ImmA/IrrE family metallo-endopeptidase [Telmatospirillum sp.]|uniref:ImmA/IrrE family metallo-endopeptidase n=1 Tax=Telmatospirillum sp. TaxID=2079197 RepID=UPI0028439E5E|nr:ImmA/IrrE family metallo-endopeptidase [Telmatospirillum sp.]MDR3440129.1 ImmA/IrrE family metallo-endopeptidase [Telmatospirillum sp.]